MLDIPIRPEQPVKTADEEEDAFFRQEQRELWLYVRRLQVKQRNQQLRQLMLTINNEGNFENAV
jgi:hypothetical protein